MKIGRITAFFLILFSACSSSRGQDYEYEDEVPQTAPVIKNSKPITSRQRLPAVPVSKTAKLNSKAQAVGKAQKSPKPQVQEVNEEESDYVDEINSEPEQPQPSAEENQENSESTSEPTKKTIKPIVRPFRTNDELLAALKRRRQLTHQTGTVIDPSNKPSTTSTESPPTTKKSSVGTSNLNRNRNRNNKPVTSPVAPIVEEQPQEHESHKKPSSRKYNTRNNARVTTSSPVPSEEEEKIDIVQTKPRFGGRGARRNI